MKFGVIYDVTTFGDPLSPYASDHNDYSIAQLDPKRALKHPRGTWKRTEAGAKAVADDYPAELPVQGHGKWCACLTKEQMREFFCEFGFDYCSLCNTMGAIGMPVPDGGIDVGCLPAWSFDSAEYKDCLVNVYVTPYPDIKVKSGKSCREVNFKRIKAAMKCLF